MIIIILLPVTTIHHNIQYYCHDVMYTCHVNMLCIVTYTDIRISMAIKNILRPL